MSSIVQDFAFHRMRPGRVAVALAVIACVAGGQVYDIVAGREHWPFSNYAMYCGISVWRETEVFRACGVTPGNEEMESTDLFAPFDPIRLGRFLSNHNDSATLSAAADSLLALAKTHPAGADLTGVRIYRCRWKHDPRARNFDRPERSLLAESAIVREARK